MPFYFTICEGLIEYKPSKIAVKRATLFSTVHTKRCQYVFI
jgi:hypothetical protein